MCVCVGVCVCVHVCRCVCVYICMFIGVCSGGPRGGMGGVASPTSQVKIVGGYFTLRECPLDQVYVAFLSIF